MGFRHAFSNKKSMSLIAGSFALSIILFLGFTVLIVFMKNAVKPLKPYAPDISILGSDNSVLLNHTLLDEINDLPNIKNIYARMFYNDIPANGKYGSSSATLISYDEPQFIWAEEMLISGKIDEVQYGNGRIGLTMVILEENNWEIGESITLDIDGKTETVQIAGILSDVPFDTGDGYMDYRMFRNHFYKVDWNIRLFDY